MENLSNDLALIELAVDSFMNAGALLEAVLRPTLKYYKGLGNNDMQDAMARLHRSFILLDSIRSFHGNILRGIRELDHLAQKMPPKSQSVISSGVQ